MAAVSPRETFAPEVPIRTKLLFLAGSAFVVLCLVVAYSLWRSHQRNSFLAAIRRYHEAGEAVLPEDFAPSVRDDPDNPVPQWRAAAAALKQLDPELTRRGDLRILSVPLTAAEYDFNRQLLEPNEHALAVARAASRMHGQPDWRIRFPIPAIYSQYPDLNAQRKLARMLKRAALGAHYKADDSEALERTREMIAQSRTMERHPTLVAHLVAIGLEALACDLACTIGPELHVGFDSDGSVRPASTAQLREVIAELLDEQPLRDGQVLAFRSERMTQVQVMMLMAAGDFRTAQGISASSSGPGPLTRLACPRFYTDARILLNWTSRRLWVAQSPDYPAALRRRASLAGIEPQSGTAYAMISIFGPAIDRAVLQDFRILTDARLAAVLLASRWYAVDHRGNFPRELADLVPTYLPAVPLDPFTAGSPLRYRGGNDPVVYSVADNGTDEGGSEQPINPDRPGNSWEQLDRVTHLKLQPQPAPPEESDDSADTSATTRPGA